MFGSAKNSNGSGTATSVERAKIERTPEPMAVVDDLPPEAAVEGLKATIAKKGFSFPEKQKPAPQSDSAAHLYVGANIRLKGEISGCDMMRIEGKFEGTAQARQLVLCPGGSFVGIADFQDAEIEGTFEGTLNVRGRLYLRAKGRIRGTFSYGQLEIERGGEVEGRIIPFEAAEAVAKATEAAPKLAEAAPKLMEVAPRSATAAAAILAATPPAAPRPVQSPVLPPIRPQPITVQPAAAAKPAAQLNGSSVP